MIKTYTRIFLFALITLLLYSCGTNTQITASWRAQKVPKNTMDKVLVISIGDPKNFSTLHAFEADVVQQLARYGVVAESACEKYGPGGLRETSEKEIVDQLTNTNFTSVMLISLVNKERDSTYVPPSSSISTYPYPYYSGFYNNYYTPFYRTYMYTYNTTATPGYYNVNIVITMQAEIYTLDKNERVYVAQTQTTDPNDALLMASDFSNVIVQNMLMQDIIDPPKKK